MRLAVQKKSNRADPYPHERLTHAGDLNRGWTRGFHGVRSKPVQFVYPTLDRETFRQATCAFGSRFRLTDEDVYSVGLYGLRRTSVKDLFRVFSHLNCYSFVEYGTVANTVRGYLERALLERAARAGNEAAFLVGLKRVTWENKSATDYSRLVTLALEAGAHIAAREIAARGAALHQEDVQLQKQARILAPPRVVERTAAVYPKHRANRDWLNAHGSEYRGQWVALREGELLAVGKSSRELKQLIGQDKSILLTIV